MRKGLCVSAGLALLLGMAACSSGGVEPAGAAMASSTFDQTVSPFFNSYCTRCHSGDNPRAGIQLGIASEEAARAQDGEFWGRVVSMIEGGQMPPASSPDQPTDAERTAVAEWIRGTVQQ